MEFFGELGKIELAKRVDEAGLQRFFPHPCEGDGGLDGSLGIFFRKRLLRPNRWRLSLDGRARGEAQVAVPA
jgi:hypothetical protein